MTALEVLRYAHLPAVALAHDEPIEVASGMLRTVPFPEWAPFVGRDVSMSESRYSRAAPVFYVDSFPLEPSDDGGYDIDQAALTNLSTRLQLDLMLISGWPLPDPNQSTAYILLPEERRRFRVPGPRDIEWMVYPATDNPLVIDGSIPLAQVDSTLERLDESGHGVEIARLFDVHPLVFDGQLAHTELITHAVMALETVLNPDGMRPLGEVFASRLDLLSVGSSDRSEQRREFFGDYYRLRNRVLHGGDAASIRDDIEGRLSEPGDALRVMMGTLADVARVLLGLALDDPGCSPSDRLQRMFAEVGDEDGGRDAVSQLLDFVRFVP